MNIECLTDGHTEWFRTTGLSATLCQLLTEDTGQDVIEYAILGAVVGIASILTWQLLVTTVGQVYSAADSDIQGVSACTPDPGGGGC